MLLTERHGHGNKLFFLNVLLRVCSSAEFLLKRAFESHDRVLSFLLNRVFRARSSPEFLVKTCFREHGRGP